MKDEIIKAFGNSTLREINLAKSKLIREDWDEDDDLSEFAEDE